MDEVQVIEEVLSGNVDRYVEIVEAYQQTVANLCFKFAGNKLDIEEITQQVFVELYIALPRFQFKSKLSTFIYRITLNVVFKELKHTSRTHFLDGKNRNFEESYSEEGDVEKEIMRNEQILLLRTSIGQLHQEQRTALVLYAFDDLSYKDIAEVMQCSVAKIESLIFRARKNLKKAMNANSQK